MTSIFLKLSRLEFAPRPSYEVWTHSVMLSQEDFEMSRMHNGERDLESGEETQIGQLETRSWTRGREGRGEGSSMLMQSASLHVDLERTGNGSDSGSIG
jgi:hypothetical protein